MFTPVESRLFARLFIEEGYLEMICLGRKLICILINTFGFSFSTLIETLIDVSVLP